MHMFDFVNRSNADYIDRLYLEYQKDPRSVDEPWRSYFAGFDAGLGPDRRPRPRCAGAVLMIMGLFMLGLGLGGVCATLPL